MMSSSRILRLPTLLPSMMAAATFLSMLAAGPASAALPDCISGGGRIVTNNNTTTGGNGGGIVNTGSFCVGAGNDFSTCASNQSGGNSLVTRNHADAGSGGGIANDTANAGMIFTDSTVDSNHADGADGGGIWIQTSGIQLLNVTISNNTAARNGGGVFNSAALICCGVGLLATNITIASNLATGNGGGVYTSDGGFTGFGSSTIADNTAVSGGGVFNDDASGGFTELLNTLLVRNGTNCAGSVQSDGSNLDTGTTCAFSSPGDQTLVGDANVGLGPLAANGGPTQGSSPFTTQPGDTIAGLSAPMKTQALDSASPAVDTGTGSATCPATDERGIPRPQDGNEDGTAACDIGAFELTPGPTACAAGAANLTVKDKEVSWKLTAPNSQAMEINQIDIAFPASDGTLQEVHLGPRIFKGSLVSPATIIAFTGKSKDRTIQEGKTDELKFKHKVAATGYDITVTFTNGCSVHIADLSSARRVDGGARCTNGRAGALKGAPRLPRWRVVSW